MLGSGLRLRIHKEQQRCCVHALMQWHAASATRDSRERNRNCEMPTGRIGGLLATCVSSSQGTFAGALAFSPMKPFLIPCRRREERAFS